MKKLIIILPFLFPAILFARQDSLTHQTFKIGKCRVTIAGLKGGKTSKNKLINARKLDIEHCEDSSKIVSFELSVTYSTKESYALVDEAYSKTSKPATNEYLTDEMISFIKKSPKGSTLLFSHIHYLTGNGEDKTFERDISFIVE